MLIGSCKKEDINQQLGIPYVRVDQYLVLSNPTNILLNSVGGWIYLEGGSRGIIVYHRSYDEFVAFDRHCTYKTEESCGRVVSDSSTTVLLKCECCPSVFSLIDGSVQQGPAIRPLLQYRAQMSAPGILHIYN